MTESNWPLIIEEDRWRQLREAQARAEKWEHGYRQAWAQTEHFRVECEALQRRLDAAAEELSEYRKLWGDMYARRSSAG